MTYLLDGKTALHVACGWGYCDGVLSPLNVFNFCIAISLLLKRGANINAVTAKGNTPLHLAVWVFILVSLSEQAYSGYSICARALLEKRCDWRALDGKGRTALDIARSLGHMQFEKALCETVGIPFKQRIYVDPDNKVIGGCNCIHHRH